MKRNKLKLVLGVLALGLVGLVFSFTDKDKDKKGKKYEVIRSSDGQITIYDTIVPKDSDYTPEDYLKDLGFNNDEDIKIINLSNQMNHFDLDVEEHMKGKHHEHSEMIFFTKDSIDCKTLSDSDTPHAVFIKKEFRTVKDGEEVTININTDDLNLNIDSIMAIHKAHHSEQPGTIEKVIIINDSVIESTDHMTFIHIDENEETGEDGKIRKEVKVEMIDHPEGKMEIRTNINGEESEPIHLEDGNKFVDVQVIGDSEDFTMVIVSETDLNPKKKRKLKQTAEEGVDLSLYPNPAKASAQLELNFSEAAPTQIVVSDMNGRVVYNENIGEIKGNYRHEFDLNNWSKGVYIIDIKHGESTISEKLIVE